MAIINNVEEVYPVLIIYGEHKGLEGFVDTLEERERYWIYQQRVNSDRWFDSSFTCSKDEIKRLENYTSRGSLLDES